MKKVDCYFAYVYRESRSGEVTYLHSAPCLNINEPMQEYWLRKAQGGKPIAFGRRCLCIRHKKGELICSAR